MFSSSLVFVLLAVSADTCSGQQYLRNGVMVKQWSYSMSSVRDVNGFLHKETHEVKKETIDHGSRGIEHTITNVDCLDGDCQHSSTGIFRNMMHGIGSRMPSGMPPCMQHLMLGGALPYLFVFDLLIGDRCRYSSVAKTTYACVCVCPVSIYIYIYICVVLGLFCFRCV